jgi:hypothetical protein
MSKAQVTDLKKFLKSFDKEIQDIVFWLREFVWDLYPKANELIYDNYNALAFGWSPTDKVGHTFCSIAVDRTSHNIHFGFFGAVRSLILKKNYSARETNTVISWLKAKKIFQRHICRSL